MSDGLTRFTARLSLPLLLVAAVFGAGIGYQRYQSEQQSLEPVDPLPPSATPVVVASPEDTSPPAPSPAATPSPTEPSKPASRQGAKDALAAGDFADAIRQGTVMRLDALVEEAYLFNALTRSIEAGRFATADAIVQVELEDGTRLVGLQEEGTRVLEQIDGHERNLKPADVASQKTLTGGEARRALQAALEGSRTKLGKDAGALALHRLAYLAFSAGFRPEGTKLLREALEKRDGAILVDMFGEGDFDRLHAARRVLAGEEASEGPIAMKDPAGSDPGGTTTRDPDPAPRDPVQPRDPDPVQPRDPDPVDPPVEPSPLSSDKRPGKRYTRPKGAVDPVAQMPAWKKADESYKAGLEVYRRTFGLSNRAASIGVKAALKEFERAQELLGPLSEQYPDHFELERRQEELAKLIIDCHRRQNIGD